jgi:NNP family nitrate/nitrite transporter-like MFS transporter
VFAVVFILFARNAPVTPDPARFANALRKLRYEPLAWVFAVFYFLTFGGFVALSIYLPTLLRDLFDLSLRDAGARVGGFVVLATLTRPLGGWLADRRGGTQVLTWVFAALSFVPLALTSTHIVPFTLGALGSAALLGAGNGAVFKLVPQYFPRETGTVTGLVGAAGGLGGFFPPLVLGLLQGRTGSYAPGFVLLACFAALCLALNWRIGLRSSKLQASFEPSR